MRVLSVRLVSSFATEMAKFFRRLVKRRDAASTGQPEHPGLGPEENEPRTKPKPKLTALYSYSTAAYDGLSFEKG